MMGDSACLMHGFPYASSIPNQSMQGESISFGRFTSESEALSRPPFPRKEYVEEAARYTQPGSVAEKKAFFEAHYKKIAAQKAAAAAAALLEQENAAREEAERALENAAADLCSIHDGESGDNQNSSEQWVSVSLSEDLDTAPCSEGNGTPQMETPLLKEICVGGEDISSATSKKKWVLSSLESSIRRKTWKVPSTPIKPANPHLEKENNLSQDAKKSRLESMDKRRNSLKSLHGLINSIPIKEPDKAMVSIAKKASSSGLTPIFSRTPKDCKTPLRTPATAKGVAKHSAQTPISENKRYTQSLTPCWYKLQSPASSTPFVLKTEERAAKRKQKLEEKFKTSEEQKVQLQKTLKEKAGHEFEKLSRSLSFKARPLPEFYKGRETPIHQTNKSPATRPHTIVLGRSNSKKQNGTVSTPPPPSQTFTMNGASKNPLKKNAANLSRYLSSSLPQRIAQENKSPNIQH